MTQRIVLRHAIIDDVNGRDMIIPNDSARLNVPSTCSCIHVFAPAGYTTVIPTGQVCSVWRQVDTYSPCQDYPHNEVIELRMEPL